MINKTGKIHFNQKIKKQIREENIPAFILALICLSLKGLVRK